MTGLPSGPLSVLQRIRGNRPAERVDEDSARCELCTEAISEDHGHLVDLQARTLLCTCRGCFLLMCSEGAGGQRYRAVPDRYLAFPGSGLTATQWESLQIPVGVAFFLMNSALGRMAAFYPGPAGATESELPLETWQEMAADNPLLAEMEPDVEGFLVRCHRRGETECFVVPIDACYELVGLMRQLWRGFDGGRDAQQAIDTFFDRVRIRARTA
jgi:Family of unknown function (DUF5947)